MAKVAKHLFIKVILFLTFSNIFTLQSSNSPRISLSTEAEHLCKTWLASIEANTEVKLGDPLFLKYATQDPLQSRLWLNLETRKGDRTKVYSEEINAAKAYLQFLARTEKAHEQLFLVSSINGLDVPYADGVVYRSDNKPIALLEIKEINPTPKAFSFGAKIESKIRSCFRNADQLEQSHDILRNLNLLSGSLEPKDNVLNYSLLQRSEAKQTIKEETALAITQIMGFGDRRRSSHKYRVLIYSDVESTTNFHINLSKDQNARDILTIHNNLENEKDHEIKLWQYVARLKKFPSIDSFVFILGKMEFEVNSDGVKVISNTRAQ